MRSLIRDRRGSGLLTAVIAGLLLVGAPGASAAPLTVTQAIRTEVKAIDANPTYRSLKTLKLATVTETKAAIPKLRTIAGLFTHAANVVANARATAAQKPGQTDWVTGAREAARGFHQFVAALGLALAGKRTAAGTALTAAEKTIDTGSALGRRGDRILGLPLTE